MEWVGGHRRPWSDRGWKEIPGRLGSWLTKHESKRIKLCFVLVRVCRAA